MMHTTNPMLIDLLDPNKVPHDNLVERAEHAFQAITLKPHDAVTHWDVMEAAAVIALLCDALKGVVDA